MKSNTKGNDNFATKMISTENLKGKNSSLKKWQKKQEERVKISFFPKLLPWTTSVTVTPSGKLLYF